MDTENDQSFATVAEIAHKLNASERTIRNYARTGVLPAVRIGNLIRFDRRAVDAVIASAKTGRSA